MGDQAAQDPRLHNHICVQDEQNLAPAKGERVIQRQRFPFVGSFVEEPDRPSAGPLADNLRSPVRRAVVDHDHFIVWIIEVAQGPKRRLEFLLRIRRNQDRDKRPAFRGPGDFGSLLPQPEENTQEDPDERHQERVSPAKIQRDSVDGRMIDGKQQTMESQRACASRVGMGSGTIASPTSASYTLRSPLIRMLMIAACSRTTASGKTSFRPRESVVYLGAT